MSNAAKLAIPTTGDDGKAQVYNESNDDYDLVDLATAAELAAHLSDSSAAHAASAVSFTPAGTIAGTDVQTAVAEVATDAATALAAHEADTTSIHGITNTANLVTTSTALGGVLGGTVGAATFASDMATQAELDAHTGDTTAAHAATAIAFTPAGSIAATTVQAAIEEVAAEAGGGGASDLDGLTDVVITAAASGDILRHNGTNWVDTPGTTHYEVAGAVAAHTGDTTDAHAASAITFTPAGTISATTVQAAIEEVASEAGGGSFDPLANDVWFATQFWS